MIFGAPPLMASDELQRQFEATDKLFARLLVEVALNPTFKETPDCPSKKQVLDTYNNEWLPYAKVWRASLWDSYERADESALNSLTGRANGWAKSCLPDFTPEKQVKGTDVEDEHKTAAWVDINAPGGGPPRPGTGFLGYKKSTLVLVGGTLIVGGLALKTIFR